MNEYVGHIRKSPLELISGPHAVQSTYVRKLTNCGNPELLDLSQYNLVPWIYSPLSDTQKHGEPVVYTDRVEIPAISKSAEELAADQGGRINQMEAAAREYIELKGDLTGASGRIHWTAAPMIWDKAKSKPKNGAVKAWTETVWGLYYQRLAMLQWGGQWSGALLDFSAAGPCPYTMLECMQE